MEMKRSSTKAQELVIEEKKTKVAAPIRIHWPLASLQIFFHIGLLIAIYLFPTYATPKVFIFGLVYGVAGGLGVTAGYHRLWCHRSYKAKLPLRVLLCIFVSMFHLKTIYAWVREHRIHHKYTNTNIDPTNIKRGFLFAHCAHVTLRRHPDFKAHMDSIPMDDVWADPVVRFEKKYHILLKTIFAYVVPTMIPVLLLDSNLYFAFFLCGPFRICVAHHLYSLTGSVSHTYGTRPYSKKFTATENGLIAFGSLGEGWHNYHHVFPWDYATSEHGYTINLTKVFIDVMAVLGLAYDLRTVSPEMIASTKLKTEIVKSY